MIWLLASAGLVLWLAYTMLAESADKAVFMPGALSPGHHQLRQACKVCHTDPLGGGEVLQQACVDCHGEERRKPFDSHPVAKFKDPRNADRLGRIDALHCVTCHTEHRPGITARDGVTLQDDLCFHCHRNVALDRPSHEGFPFDGCKASGCHNFHDNRALYTNFLIKHLDEPETLGTATVPETEFLELLDQLAGYPLEHYPVTPLGRRDADAPRDITLDTGQKAPDDWAATAHAAAGVNCTACHETAPDAEGAGHWIESPGMDACSNCHRLEVERFRKGRHGMRLAAGLSPLSVADARLPMREEAARDTLTCNSCHPAHRYDATRAAVDSCLECHNDSHSLAYRDSPHYTLWQKEIGGDLPDGSGVSCATCHMPRVAFDVSDWLTRVMVDHNQSANLSPNSKMIRTTCLHCHGLEFSIDALADRQLIDNNFRGRPSLHVETMGLAAAEAERRASEAGDEDDTSMFGF
ncbi:MAG: cytochrome c3 family protein [Gammaproteobacteria bacterium]